MGLTWTYVDGINAVGAPIDWEAFKEIKDNVDLVDAKAGTAPADSTFNGTAGRAITVADQGGVGYLPIVVATEDTGGALGDVWVVIDSATQFTVFNAGSFRGAFRWKVVK